MNRLFEIWYCKFKIWKLERESKYYEKVTSVPNEYKLKQLKEYKRKLIEYTNLPKQTCFVFCPICDNELISSNSFISDEEFVTYKCTNCGEYSYWDFDIAPFPILLNDKEVHRN